MHMPTGWTWWYLWNFAKFLLPIVVSGVALAYVLYDRRPRLVVKTRKGLWSMVRESLTVRGQEVIFQGIIEVYNLSSRANAIRSYEVRSQVPGGKWSEMEAEHSEDDPGDGKGPRIFNQSPLTLAPFSGIEVRVMGIGKVPKSKQMTIRIQIEDLYGKYYEIETVSYS